MKVSNSLARRYRSTSMHRLIDQLGEEPFEAWMFRGRQPLVAISASNSSDVMPARVATIIFVQVVHRRNCAIACRSLASTVLNGSATLPAPDCAVTIAGTRSRQRTPAHTADARPTACHPDRRWRCAPPAARSSGWRCRSWLSRSRGSPASPVRHSRTPAAQPVPEPHRAEQSGHGRAARQAAPSSRRRFNPLEGEERIVVTFPASSLRLAVSGRPAARPLCRTSAIALRGPSSSPRPAP